MIVFVLTATAICLITVLVLVLPLWRESRMTALEREAQNIHYARERLAELEQQLESDKISANDYDALKLEIESTLALDIDLDQATVASSPVASQANGIVIALVCTLIPFSAIGLYQLTGTPQAIVSTQPQPESGPATASQPDIDNMLAKLEMRLQENPDDPEGWVMLARSRMALGNYTGSLEAYKRLLEFTDEDANVYAQMADAAAMANNGDLSGAAQDYITRALGVDPNQPQALWLAGLAAAQQGQQQQAQAHWNRLLPLLENLPEQQQELREIMAQSSAAEQNSATTESRNTDTITDSPEAHSNQGLRVRVELSPEMSSQASADETVFVFARAQTGPPAPLAVKALRVSDLPVEVRLSDADSMLPQLKLSAFKEIVLTARIAKSGNPVAQSGDLQSQPFNTTNDHSDIVTLLIAEIVP